MTEKGTVYLVGAGPGDYRLLTLKAKECIEKADTIIYDRLVNKRVLEFASQNAEIIYAGKSPDKHTLRQHEINELIIKKALDGKTVTRLKGGDPFVFGRGGEEALALREREIPFEIVPGVTSAVAAPAYAGIPVTHRGITSTVGFITGNEDPEKEDSDIRWDKIATGMGTLVFLMGMGNLSKIVSKLMEYGRSPQTPVALVRWGTLSKQETLTGTLENIARKAQEENFKNPAVIVVGEVVNLREQIKWFENRPLFGKRILVTRSRAQASEFSKMIEELGGEAYSFPTIAIEPPEDFAPLDDAISRLKKYDWIIFTSANGVKSFFKRLKILGKDVRSLGNSKLAAIGPRTSETLENYGLNVDFVPGEYRAEAVVEGLKQENLMGKKILLPRADIARSLLPDELRKAGALVDEVVAYRTVRATEDVDVVKEMLLSGDVDFVTFTSSSTVKNFFELMGKDTIEKIKGKVKTASIGPITSRTASKLGLNMDVEAAQYTLEGLLEAIINYQKE